MKTNKEVLDRNIPELIQSRSESKYFIPDSYSAPAKQEIHDLAIAGGYELEHHEHPISRTTYYFAGDTHNAKPGFSIRYREYTDQSLEDSLVPENSTGFFEIKWTTADGNNVGKKLRVSSDFDWSPTLTKIAELAYQQNLPAPMIESFLEVAQEQVPNLDTTLRPLVVVEYVRNRYTKMDGDKQNAISIDTNLKFFGIDKTENGSTLEMIGDVSAIIVEHKESFDDVGTRWQLNRALVRSNADRFYGKKSEALNRLTMFRKKKIRTAIANQFQGIEIESKIDVNSNVEGAFELFHQILGHFQNDESAFEMIPTFPYVNSQTSINTYGYDPANPDSEFKLMVGPQRAKIGSKDRIDEVNGVHIRTEEKENLKFEFNRQKAREVVKGKKKTGKIQRIRRSFYILSKATKRAFQVAVDFNWRQPSTDNNFFSQVEVEYVATMATNLDQSATMYDIADEVRLVMQEIRASVNDSDLLTDKSSRKVDLLDRK